LAAVTRGLRKGCAKYGVVVNQILCCISFRPAWSIDCVELAATHRLDTPCAVVGIDVAAGEVGDSPSGHVAAFQRAKELGLNITIHAGEIGPAENVRHAVDEFGARRIGHGYAAAKCPEILSDMVRKGVHFEVCPTSSLETGAWQDSDWQRHPARILLDADASVSFNSDDPSVFATSLSEELELCLTSMCLTRSEILRSSFCSVDAAFGDDIDKAKARNAIQQYASNYVSKSKI